MVVHRSRLRRMFRGGYKESNHNGYETLFLCGGYDVTLRNFVAATKKPCGGLHGSLARTAFLLISCSETLFPLHLLR